MNHTIRERTRPTAVLSVTAALAVALLTGCGGQDKPGGSTVGAEKGSAPEAATSPPPNGAASVVRVDGTEYPFAFHGFTVDESAAAINGVTETCDPSFMGAAFRAEGYLVDDTGAVVIDNSLVAGRLLLTLPTSKNAGEVIPEVSVQILDDAIDGKDTLGNGVPGEFTVEGTTASGRFEVPRRGASGTTYDVEVEVTCPG
jgi:hypothetical protein